MGWSKADMNRAIYITRSDIGWYSRNANAYRKPLEVASKYDATLCVGEICRVPQEIAERCTEIVRFRGLWGLMKPRNTLNTQKGNHIFTGFDFPCMFKAWRLKKKFGCKWTVFLWDPPCLAHRDGFPPLRWAIDAVFRFFAKRCDRLVLNIHPGLLEEIGYRPREGQLELRMQDAWENVKLWDRDNEALCKCENDSDLEYDFGILANWEKGKGGPLMAAALKQMPGKKCLWIGDAQKKNASEQIVFTGRLPQNEAFALLRKCHVLVVPYLSTRAFKWNYPLKLFEYLQLGLPILASDNPGNVAVAKRYEGRIKLFRSGDVCDLVLKAMELMETTK